MASNFIITCLGPAISPAFLGKMTSALAGENIRILNMKPLAQTPLECVEITIAINTPFEASLLSKKLAEFSRSESVDVIVQEDCVTRKEKRLIALDMDSTLIQVEVIDELAKEAGIGEAVASITHRAMNGELNFKESLQQRVGLLKGLPVTVLKQVYDRIPYTPGAALLLSFLKKQGCKTAVLSGGFDYFTLRVKDVLQLDYAYSNRLDIEDGHLTGKIVGEIVNGEKKAALLEEIANKEGLSLDQVIAIGDGANDLPMIKRAGLGIAFNAKPAVRAAANHSITQESLLSVLYLLGFSETEIKMFSLEN